MTFVLFALASIFANNAGALHKASDVETKLIQGHLNDAKMAEDVIDADLREELKRAEKHTRTPDSRMGGMSDEQLAAEIKEQEVKCQQSYQRAIRVALPAYGILPVDKEGHAIMPTRASVYPGYDNKSATWVPVYTQAFRGNNRRLLLPNGATPQQDPPLPKAVATTSADGVTTIFGRFGTAAEFAVMLYHERIHYDQMTTRGQGDVFTDSHREVEAYKTGLNDLWRFEFDKATEDDLRSRLDKNRLGYQFADWKEQKESESIAGRLKGILHRGKPRTPYSQDVLPHSSEELAKIMGEAKEFEQQIRREEVERHLASNQRHLDSLRALAERLCSDPGSVTQDDFDRLEYAPDRGFYGQELDALIKTGEHFSTCAGGRLYSILLDLARGIRPVAQGYIPAVPSYVPPPAEALPAVPDVPIPLPKQQPPPLFDSDLAALAEKACSGGGVTAEDLKKFGWFPMPHVDIDEGGYRRKHLSGCALSVFEYLRRLNKDGGRLDAAAINGQAGRGGQGGQGGDEGSRRQPDSRRRDWSKEPNPPYINR